MDHIKFALLGGDLRQAWLARLLAEDGHHVCVYAGAAALPGAGVTFCATAEAALEGASCVILPLPVCSAPGVLNAPFSASRIELSGILKLIPSGSLVLAGKADSGTVSLAARCGLSVEDYFRREELTVANAALTAQGAIPLLLQAISVDITQAKVLVVGFGRIGKLTAMKLRALGAQVTASARKPGDLAWIDAFGCAGVETGDLSGCIGGFDAIINTVPARVLPRHVLAEARPGTFILELASAPGGFLPEDAAELGLRTAAAPGLPGKAAPISAGAAIHRAIKNILREKGVLK